VSSNEAEKLTIIVMDIQGRIVYQTSMENELLEIPSINWNAGMYYIRVASESTSKTIAFIKE
jgi:hypothetical protein